MTPTHLNGAYSTNQSVFRPFQPASSSASSEVQAVLLVPSHRYAPRTFSFASERWDPRSVRQSRPFRRNSRASSNCLCSARRPCTPWLSPETTTGEASRVSFPPGVGIDKTRRDCRVYRNRSSPHRLHLRWCIGLPSSSDTYR